jgi:hypothetical protein
MKLLAIDPGNKNSAWVVWDGQKIVAKDYYPNEDMLGLVCGSMMAGLEVEHMAIEMVQSFGMAVGAEVFETVYWTGRFVQAWGKPFTRVYRSEVKMHLCGSMRAKDANIRQRLIDLVGAQGKKKSQGPTFGVSGDMWSALAVAKTWWDTKKEQK